MEKPMELLTTAKQLEGAHNSIQGIEPQLQEIAAAIVHDAAAAHMLKEALDFIANDVRCYSLEVAAAHARSILRQEHNGTCESANSRPDEFEALARPLIKWLNDFYHPHHTIVITPTNAELLEGVISTGEITDYLRD